MVFNSLAFLVFAAVFFVGYFLLNGKQRLLWLLVGSYFFYAWWDWRFTGLLAFSSIVDYIVAKKIAATSNERSRKSWLLISLTANIGVLGIFKYFNFFIDSAEIILTKLGFHASYPTLNIILPVGISFFTFQSMSYTIDVYRRKMDSEPSLLRFATYVSMFPQLVAGPIVRAAKLLPQLHCDHEMSAKRIVRGLELIIWGFFLKVCLADNAAQIADPRFSVPEIYNAGSHVIGTLAFAMQIYGDFAGYSLIAIGLGRIMGFEFGVNFNRPYFATNFSDFWRRWHISLSSWLRDYLYISLGGNREGVVKTYRNLALTMLLGGLWHGAGWTFVIWGALHGSYLVLQRVASGPYRSLMKAIRLPGPVVTGLAWLSVFILTNVAWIFFRSESTGDAVFILRTIAAGDNWSLGAGEELIALAKVMLLSSVVIVVDLTSARQSVKDAYIRSPWFRLFAMALLCWAIALFGVFEGASFIYFQF
jgi:D-alanyl-lipoteichoic acid acyltransferase DltB (MBOAT superfamily)